MSDEKPSKAKFNLVLTYSFFMFVLLFVRKSAFVFGVPYKEQLMAHFEPEFFKNILHYWGQLIDPGEAISVRNNAFMNLAGNVILFAPIGIFLPTFCKNLRNLILVIIVTAIGIFIIEGIQMLTLVGTFDVDDIILNTCGSTIGYLIWRICYTIKNYKKNKDNPYTMY